MENTQPDNIDTIPQEKLPDTQVYKKTDWLRRNVISVARVHFLFVLVFGLFTIAFDGWHLTPPAVVSQRWTMAAFMLVGVTGLWYLAHQRISRPVYYKALVFALILIDLAVAAFCIYTERGMTSRGVMLFTIPIAVAAVTYSRSAIFATASLSTAVYVLSAVKYFYNHPYEGYKVELYGIVGFYSVMFFILAGVLAVIAKASNRAEE